MGRGAQGTARFLRGERWGVLSFGYFSLHKQRKVPQGAGAERPQLGFKAARKRVQPIENILTPALSKEGEIKIPSPLIRQIIKLNQK